MNHGDHEGSLGLFRTMMNRGLSFDSYTLGSLLKSVACSSSVGTLGVIHGLVLKNGISADVYVGSALLDGYVKCGPICDARKLFDEMPYRNVVSWNAVIAGYAQVGRMDEALHLFGLMEEGRLMPDEGTFASVLTLLDAPEFKKELLQLHCKIVKYGWAGDTIACNGAITAYSLCGLVGDAEKLFDGMDKIRDLVTWNSMLAAYALDGRMAQAIEMFRWMIVVGVEQDMYTYSSMISAFSNGEQSTCGRSLHGMVVKKGLDSSIIILNALIAMYTKFDSSCAVQEAVKCFELMEARDNVSWNSMLTGLSQHGLGEEAMKFFCRMIAANLRGDHYSFCAALRSCSDLAALQLGMQVHGSVVKSGYGVNEFVVSSLIYMYSKSGILEEARKSFDESGKDSSVSWNSIIFAYAQHGKGHAALALFSEMLNQRVAPDHVTFVGILSACSHIGLVEEGRRILETMDTIYRIPLRMEHYACGVDLFGRAGRLDDVKRLIGSMPFEPDAMVWMTLLGACRMHGDVELASQVAKHLMLLIPKEHSTYVILSNLYSRHKLWEGRALVQRTMRERGVSKVPGWSWIEINHKIHAFNADDRYHVQSKEIYEILIEIMEKLEIDDYSDDVEFLACDMYLS